MPNKLDLDWTKGKKVTFSYRGDCKTTKITNIEGGKNVNIGNSEYSILNMLAMDGFSVGCGPDNNPKNKNIQNGKHKAKIIYSSTTDCMGNIQKIPYISIYIDEGDKNVSLIIGGDNIKNLDEEISFLPDNGRHSIECLVEKISGNDILWKLEEGKSTCFEPDEDGNEACNNYTRNIKFKTNIISKTTTIISDVSNCVFVDYDGTKKKCE